MVPRNSVVLLWWLAFNPNYVKRPLNHAEPLAVVVAKYGLFFSVMPL